MLVLFRYIVLLWILTASALQASAQSVDSLLLELSKVSSPSEKQQILTELAILSQGRTNYTQALAYYDEALEIGQVDANAYARDFLLRNKAFCFEELNDYNKALQIYEEVERGSTEENEARVRLWKKIAELSALQDQFDKSIAYHQRALAYYSRIKNYAAIAREHNELGYLYNTKGQQSLSLTHFKECENILKQTGAQISDRDRASIYLNLGVVYAQITEYSKAEAALMQSYNISKSKLNAKSAAGACNYLAAYYLVIGNADLAKKYNDEALNLLGKPDGDIEKNQLLLNSYKVKCEYLLHIEDYEQYKKVLQQYDQLRGQLAAQELYQKKMLLENQFEQERKEYQVRIQLSDKQRLLEKSQVEQEKQDKELLIRQQELQELTQEKELAEIKFTNQKLQEDRLNQMLQISRERALSENQAQKIVLLEKNRQLQDLKLERQKKDILLLELEKRNKNVEIEQEKSERRAIYALIALFTILLFVSLTAWYINRRTAKELDIKNKRLVAAQDLIEKQNDELRLSNEDLELHVEERTRELKQSNFRLASNNEQLQQFTYIISHNLRAPIARILGLGQVLHITKPGSAEHEQVFSSIIDSSKELDQVIKDLHTILEVRENPDHKLEWIEIQGRADSVCQQLKSEIEASGVEIEMNFKNAPNVRAVPAYLDSILYNLISNAIKYRNEEIQARIVLRSEQKGNMVELTVTDNGLGIDLKKHGSKIFGLYKRFHMHKEGKGMGLYLVKTEVEAMGGNIRVESSLERGTSFSIQLPATY